MSENMYLIIIYNFFPLFEFIVLNEKAFQIKGLFFKYSGLILYNGG